MFRLALTGVLACAAGAASAGEVTAVSLDQGATGTRAEIQLAGSGQYRTLTLAGPDRLVVDLPASRARAGLRLPGAAGIVRSVRTGQPDANTLRIVFDLSAPVAALKPRMEQLEGGARLVIEWPGDGPASVPAPSVAVAAPIGTTSAASPSVAPASPTANAQDDAARATALLTAKVVQAGTAPAPSSSVAAAAQTGTPASTPPPTVSPQAILNGQAAGTVASSPAAGSPGSAAANLPSATTAPAAEVAAGTVAAAPAVSPGVATLVGTRPLVIAIDPGHGGQDPGAIGPTGRYEKHAVLAISKELARQINATPGMRAYLVRDNDVYVERPQRARKARAAKADMFVSIHADAAENRSAWGSSVYVLSLRGASSQHARWLADKENASDLVGGVRLSKDTLSNVLLDLAQSGHMKASQDAAGHVLDGLKQLGKTHKPQIEFANFEVLRNSDMPAMLVETGFISNPEEEKRLFDPAHQRKVAAAVLTGIQSYFTRQPPPGTLFAARAQAAAEARAAASGGSAGAP
jgi:N-acetylmuramoyl-L-alanine amidase